MRQYLVYQQVYENCDIIFEGDNMVTIEKIKQLNELEYQIYLFLVNNKEMIAKQKLKAVADALHVSPSMVTRVLQKLDFDGFTQFKVQMRIQVNQENHIEEEGINYLIDYFNKVNSPAALEPIKNAALLMESVEEVLFFGVGLSGAMGKYGSYLFNRNGIKSFAVEDFSHRFDLYDNKTGVIVLTISGETREVNDQIQIIRQSGAKVVVITNSQNTTAGKLSDATISYYVPSSKNRYFYSDATQVPVMYIFETLIEQINKNKAAIGVL